MQLSRRLVAAIIISFLLATLTMGHAIAYDNTTVVFQQTYSAPRQLPQPGNYCVNSKWNQPRNVSANSTNPHRGTDILMPQNTTVKAIESGTIVRVTWIDDTWKYRVTQTIPGTSLYFNYVHLDPVYVQEGQQVTAGQDIGKIGTPNHLHFGVSTNAPSSYSATIWQSNWPFYTTVSAWRYGKDLDIAADPYFDTITNTFSLDFYVSTDLSDGQCHWRPMQSLTIWHRKYGSNGTFQSDTMTQIDTYRWKYSRFTYYYPVGTTVEFTITGVREDEACCPSQVYDVAVFPAKYAQPDPNPNNYSTPAVYVVTLTR